MVVSIGRHVQYLIRHVSLLVIGMVGVSCNYPPPPRLSPDDTTPTPDDAMAMDVAVDMPTDAPTPPPSCVGLPASCGTSANCCQAVTIPGGTFYRSYDGAGFNDMGFPATISTFALEQFEVTVGRFRAFVTAGKGTRVSPPATGSGSHPNLSGSGWDSAWNMSLAADTAALTSAVKCDATYQTWTDTPGANEVKPMNCVNWYEAMAFCIWDGGYLPTESEWNYAASGGSDQRAFPWSKNPANSTTIDCAYANYFINTPSGTFCVNGTTGGTNKVGSESTKGDAKWGNADLAGNVVEWTLDWFKSTYASPCNDCANLTAANGRVFRGGGFGSDAMSVRSAGRSFGLPISRDYTIGIRCARMP